MEIEANQCKTNNLNVKQERNVAYIYNSTLLTLTDRLPKIRNRASTVHSLIEAYGLLDKMRLVSPVPASDEDLTLFHSQPYVDCLRRLSEQDDDEKYDEEAEQFGLSYTNCSSLK